MDQLNKHTILLGGIGGDSHSVGMAILRHALVAEGYNLRFLGTQNSLEEFAQLASLCNVVMISSLDGHARYYLREFPRILDRYEARRPLWYLGGNLDIGDGLGCEREFMEMGIDRVFVKFVDASTVIETLRRDLEKVEPMNSADTIWKEWETRGCGAFQSVLDTRMDIDLFTRTRREVLNLWKTGIRAASLDDNAAFIADQPSFTKIQKSVNEGKSSIIIQPRSGVPLLKQQIRIFKALKRIGARVLSYQIDSLTRNNNYIGSEEAIRESAATGIATINGFPLINHGVPGLRQIINEVQVPLQTRHSTRDPRLLAELSYAGGVTSFEGGAICYNIPYYKDYPVGESIFTWQYVDRLTGLYYERYGIVLDREFFGTLTATLIPPSLAITTNILESILAAQQGVKALSLGYAEQGHRIQDIAAIRMMGRLAGQMLSNLGYKDVYLSTVFHQYMAAFPPRREQAAHLIYNSAVTAALSGATRVIVKTPAEATRIPTVEDNIEGISIVSQGVSDASEVEIDEARIADECELIGKEVEAMIESVIFSGKGDITRGIISAFDKGYLDIPFSPSRYNRGEVMGARDVEGAVRYLNTGNMKLTRELCQFHEEKMQERRRIEGIFSPKQNYLLIEKDVTQIPRGYYEKWPLCQ